MTLRETSSHKHGASAVSGFMLATLLALFGVQANAQGVDKHVSLTGIQSGTVISGGAGFAAISLTDKRAPGLGQEDGSAVVGLGFGNAKRNVGVQVAVHATSLRDGVGNSGYVSLKFSRRLLNGRNPVSGSLRLGQLANWGKADGLEETAAMAFTRSMKMTLGNGEVYPTRMTLGAGTHLRNSYTDPGVFAGVGIGLTETTAASIAWTGDGIRLGTKFRFDWAENASFGLSIDDATNRINKRRVIVSVGYRFDLFGG